jgi:hypothetical protein
MQVAFAPTLTEETAPAPNPTIACPKLLFPQQVKFPAAETEHVDVAPALIFVTEVTSVGTVDWPYMFEPQHCAVSSFFITHV